MPTISMFYGILVLMFFRDNRRHHLPHIHVRYQGEEAAIAIDDGRILDGSIPPKQHKLVQAWIEIHQEELQVDWELAVSGEEPFRIAPLQIRGDAMLQDVITVKALPDYQLELKFNNGELRRFDMRPLLTMKPWNRIASLHLFERARVEYGTVVWPGEIDIAPETLYDDSLPITVHEDSTSYGPDNS